jgi:hypothetical protein
VKHVNVVVFFEASTVEGFGSTNGSSLKMESAAVFDSVESEDAESVEEEDTVLHERAMIKIEC